MLFAGWEGRIGKNCARSLEYSPRPYSRQRAQFFPVWANQGGQILCLFFSLRYYFKSNFCVEILIKAIHLKSGISVCLIFLVKKSKPFAILVGLILCDTE